MRAEPWPVGVSISADIEDRKGVAEGNRAWVRRIDPSTRHRQSVSQPLRSVPEAEDGIRELQQLANAACVVATPSLLRARKPLMYAKRHVSGSSARRASEMKPQASNTGGGKHTCLA